MLGRWGQLQSKDEKNIINVKEVKCVCEREEGGGTMILNRKRNKKDSRIPFVQIGRRGWALSAFEIRKLRGDSKR